MFGEKVRARRRELGLSQEDLAGRAGIDVKTVRMIETGRRTPRPSTVRQLADALQLAGADREQFVAAAAGGTAEPPHTRPGPAQLPPDVFGFVGRTAQLDALDTIVAVPGRPATVVISALSGSAGVGKTALAVHWAHRVRDRFPDGQLYVNLRGFDPAGSALTPSEAVCGFLDALSVPPQSLPADLDAQVALYRSLLADRRMLLVLDNARDSAQVRPLLPGSTGSLVLVTSRNELTGLIAGHGAHPLDLNLLNAAESRELLARRLGAGRLAAEPAAVDEIVARCARLPLALTIVAARAAMRPDFPLVALAGELRDSRDRLDALTGDDPASDVRAVFSWSYRTLSPDAARLFRLFGLHPGPDISAAAAASLAGTGVAGSRPLLTELTRANLLVERAPGRFTCHDLLRAYAGEQARAEEPDELRQAAERRMLDHYLHTALAADGLLAQHRNAVTPPAAEPGVTVEPLADRRAALEWFSAEQQVLVSAVEYAAGIGLDTRVWHLAWALATYFHRRGQGQDWVVTQEAAMAAAERLADVDRQVRTHGDLAGGFFKLGRVEDAQRHLERALELFVALGDHAGQAGSHLNLGQVLQHQGRHREALDHDRQGLELFRRTGSLFGQASALNAIGWCHAQLGEFAQSLDYCEQALALHLEVGQSSGLAEAWDSVGYAHHHLGHFAEAMHCYREAARTFREGGDRYNQAASLVHLGDAHEACGEARKAGQTWRRALIILEDLDHPDAVGVRAKLEGRSDERRRRTGAA